MSRACCIRDDDEAKQARAVSPIRCYDRFSRVAGSELIDQLPSWVTEDENCEILSLS
jgi:hypothetical protein